MGLCTGTHTLNTCNTRRGISRRGQGHPIPKSYSPQKIVDPPSGSDEQRAQSNLKPLSKQGVMKKAVHLNPSMRTRHFVLSNQSTYGYTLKYYASNPACGDKAKGETK